MPQEAPDDIPDTPAGGLGGLVSAARDGKAEAPQSELNAAKPASEEHDSTAPHNQSQ